jgi:beta-N-acetylhexosaminidase
VDLAPVSDVPTFGGAFIWQQGRAFSFNAGTVASFASAFAFGLQARGVAATAKHFPGLGAAPIDTDFKRQELHPTAKQRAAALKPYEQMIPKGLDVVMLTVAGLPAYDRTGASAALSRPIIQNLLRGKLKFRGVAITDALGTPTGHDERTAGVLAATAGSDILLYTDSAPGELGALRSALHAGKITTANADASYQRIMALKTKLGLA